MIVSLIVAVSDNGVIGKDGKIPWKLPHDLKRFKELTLGKAIIMGRKTFESLPKQRPLPDRLNIVVTSKPFNVPGCLSVKSIGEALEELKSLGHEEVFLIGGSQIYLEGLSLANIVYVTRVRTIVEGGDAFFPIEAVESLWECIVHTTDEEIVGEPRSESFVYKKPKLVV